MVQYNTKLTIPRSLVMRQVIHFLLTCSRGKQISAICSRLKGGGGSCGFGVKGTPNPASARTLQSFANATHTTMSKGWAAPDALTCWVDLPHEGPSLGLNFRFPEPVEDMGGARSG